ncbi:acyloxyacyl hydrolase-like [Corticium candelabrum]|uniref:acyloxyacyl hydrolase-like n=1 Tax=Corticium candelabrum TaxID=121492 RepID=UPI002E2632BF|nr:acyloxyacyl hydrolase-like [Corticium candelabrum]
MMTSLIVAVLLLLFPLSSSQLRVSGKNGGTACVACTLIVGMTEQLSQYHNQSVVEAMEMICRYLPEGLYRRACDSLFEEYGAAVIKLLETKETGDIVCLALGMCTNETGHICHIFPLPERADSPALSKRVQRANQIARSVNGYSRLSPCSLPGISEICKLIDRFADDHLPLYDVDGDKFSLLETFRGSSWRGKDCDDLNSDIYPGRRSTGDAEVDTNCNGIVGIDPVTHNTYEDMWCNGTQQYGTVLLGDSVGAHFHIPPAWLTASKLNELVFEHLPFMVENELDWPQFSSVTAFMNISWLDVIDGPVDSLYLKLREINQCNHRDYQNIGVNGARSSAMANDIVKSLARHQDLDHPLFIVHELLGNDVCNGHHDMSHMTTPEEFYANNKRTFEYIDQHVPPHSRMFVYGIVDGRILYNSLHNRIHPIGQLNNDVTYSDLYDYLNCLEISPCFGWLNTDEKWRNQTTQRGKELNSALKRLLDDMTFTNLEVLYIEDVINETISVWEAQGGKVWQLLEPVDGFHCNQLANALAAQVVWSKVEKDYPHWIPPVNPNNADINNKFGDQGGY